MKRYLEVVKYWAYRHLVMMSAMMVLIVGLLYIRNDPFTVVFDLQRTMIVIYRTYTLLMLVIAITFIAIQVMHLIYLSFCAGREVGVVEYEDIVQLLRDSVLTQQEVSQATHNQMIFYEDYYGLWLLAQKRKTKNEKVKNKQKLENDRATQLEEFNAVKQSLVEQLEDYDKPQEKN